MDNKKYNVNLDDLLETFCDASAAINDCTNAIYDKTKDRSIWALCDYALTAQARLTEATKDLQAMGIDKNTAYKLALQRSVQ